VRCYARVAPPRQTLQADDHPFLSTLATAASRRSRKGSAAGKQVQRLNNLLGVILGDSDSTGETIDIVEHLLGGAGDAGGAEQLLEALEPLQALVATLSSSHGTAGSSAPPTPARPAGVSRRQIRSPSADRR